MVAGYIYVLHLKYSAFKTSHTQTNIYIHTQTHTYTRTCTHIYTHTSALSLCCPLCPMMTISVGFRPCVWLVGGRLVQSELQNLTVNTEDDRYRSIWKAMTEIVIKLVLLR